ncbi:hypothetical protein EON65_34355 [archaeon]|nr:MAG: hypothetical protein EON65_34355 [archaeon]
MYVRVIIVRFTLICVLIGSLAYHDGDALIDAPDLTTGSHNFAYKPATNATSVCFVLVAMSLVGVAFTVPHLHANIRLMKFEVNSGLQGVVSSWLSLILIDLPIYILVALVISLIMYSMVDIESSLNTYLGTTLMVLLTGYSVALNCAIWCASLPLATFVFSLISSFFLLFCGYLQVIDNLSPLWYWVSNVVFTRYAFQAYMVATFTKADDGDAFLAIYNFENTSAKSCFSRMQLLGKLADVAVKSHEDYATFDSSQSKPTIAAKESEREENKGNIRSAHESIISVAARTEKSGSSGKSFRSTLALEKPQDMLNIERSLTSYGLTLSDNEAKIIFVPKNMITTLSFHGIRYVQDIGTNDSAFSEPVLNGVSGTISPGNCVCILDGQEDRSSLILLQILAGRGQATGKISGVIAANKHRIGKHQGYVNAAYVQHGDAPCMAPLTVRETLTYAALLRRTDQYNTITRLMARSPEDYVNEFELLGRSGDVENRVAEVISMLGLDHIADCMIGQVAEHRERRTHLDKSLSVARHLSSYRHRLYSALCKASATSITPAQLRLVSIGMELVNRPGLIFLEDPFLGLEWQDAERVAVVLRSLAEGNRTVICNISKPVTRIVSYFHEMFLLGSGLCLYSGPVSNVAEHFENVGYARGDMSMVEYVLDIAGDRGRLASTSGKRGARLSPADLADLNRSLVNIKSGQSPEHLEEENSMATESELDRGSLAGRSGEDREISSAKDSISTNNPIRITSIASNASNSTSDSRSKKLLPDYAFDESMYISPKNTTLSSRSNKQKNMTVTMNIRDVPVGPTARILLRRGLKLLLSDVSAHIVYYAVCFCTTSPIPPLSPYPL